MKRRRPAVAEHVVSGRERMQTEGGRDGEHGVGVGDGDGVGEARAARFRTITLVLLTTWSRCVGHAD